jgi:hypothetical protein
MEHTGSIYDPVRGEMSVETIGTPLCWKKCPDDGHGLEFFCFVLYQEKIQYRIR